MSTRIASSTRATPCVVLLATLSRCLPCLLCFAHGPPFTQLLVPSGAHRDLHVRGAIYGAWSPRPPRGVTVFAERCDEIGAAQPQKRRRHCTPARACRFVYRRRTFPPPGARSRWLQRAFVVWPRVQCGQPSRPRASSKPLFRGGAFPSRPRRVTSVASRAKRNATVRAGNGRATPARPACGSSISRLHVPPRNPSARTCVACGSA